MNEERGLALERVCIPQRLQFTTQVLEQPAVERCALTQKRTRSRRYRGCGEGAGLLANHRSFEPDAGCRNDLLVGQDAVRTPCPGIALRVSRRQGGQIGDLALGLLALLFQISLLLLVFAALFLLLVIRCLVQGDLRVEGVGGEAWSGSVIRAIMAG